MRGLDGSRADLGRRRRARTGGVSIYVRYLLVFSLGIVAPFLPVFGSSPASAAINIPYVYQIGAYLDTYGNIGVQTGETVYTPADFYDGADAYYWPGEYLQNGEFVQAGWGLGPPCQTNTVYNEAFNWSAAFDAAGDMISFVHQSCTSAGNSYTQHTYSLFFTPNPCNVNCGGDGWTADVDSTFISRVLVSSMYSSSLYPAYEVGEISGDAVSGTPFEPNTNDYMFGDFYNASFTTPPWELTPIWTYVPAASTYVAAPCPPYGLTNYSTLPSNNLIAVGYSQPCAAANQSLWG